MDDAMRREGAARLLQVAIDMLENPAAKQPPNDPKYPPQALRTDYLGVEAAHRAIVQAQELLRVPSPEPKS
jgi:hypothetical protein